MPLSHERFADIANKLFWDEQVDRVALAAWLAGKGALPDGLEEDRVYARMMTTVPWYELVDLIPKAQWAHAFQEKVLVKLFPPALRFNYRHAARLLLS